MSKLVKKSNYQMKLLRFKDGAKTDSRGQYSPNNYYGFSGDMYLVMYEVYLNAGYDPDTSDRLARYTTAHKAMESGYGSHIFGNVSYNYGGIGGLENKQNFNSLLDYALSYLKLLQSKYPNALKATTLLEYSNSLFTDNYGYDPYDINGEPTSDPKKYDKEKSLEIYWSKLQGTEKRANTNIDLWRQSNSLPLPTKVKSVKKKDTFNTKTLLGLPNYTNKTGIYFNNSVVPYRSIFDKIMSKYK